jgi:RNA polymerase sigma-70 factor (ECF subfamily)
MSEERNFEEFMAAYQDMVFTTAMRILGNSAEAEDVSQEVFLKAYDRFDELNLSRTAGGWLKTVTRNLCLNHLSRYRARWTFFSDLKRDDADDDREFDIPAEDTQAEEAERADQRQLLETALQKLPPAYRVPLVLYHFEDLSYEEIAARLKLSLAKVKTDIHRGRDALRKKLKLDLEGELSGTVGVLPAGRVRRHSNP